MSIGTFKIVLDVRDPENFRQRVLSGESVTFSDVRIYPVEMETAIQEIYHWQRLTSNSLIRLDSGGKFFTVENFVPRVQTQSNQPFEQQIDIKDFLENSEELLRHHDVSKWGLIAKEYTVRLHSDYHHRNVPYRYTKPVFHLLSAIMIQGGNKTQYLNHLQTIKSMFPDRNRWAGASRYSYPNEIYPKHLKERMLERAAPDDLRPSLTTELRPYQKRSLRFCMDIEDGDNEMWIQVTTTQSIPIYYSPYLMQFSNAPKKCKGGFLCDEMGLGKTVVTLGLTLMRPTTEENTFHTLVVCPVSLVSQWINEAKKHIENVEESELYLHHGQRRYRCSQQLNNKKVVVTTYGILTREWARNGPLLGKRWHRVVFDECHILKNPATQQYKAAKGLAANHKWFVTGTPGLELHELKNALKIIDESAFPNLRWFYRENICCPRYYILSHYMIRHQKDMRDGEGNPIVTLPECATENVLFELSTEEKAAYDSLKENTATRLPFMVGISAFKELQNLRRRLSSADTIPTNASSMPVVGDGEREIVEERMNDDQCCICLDVFERPVVTGCNHAFCLQCITNVIDVRSRCPMCRTPISTNSLRLLHPLVEEESDISYTSKLNELHRILTNKNPGDKFLIFVQFDQSIQAIQQMLDESKILFSQLTSKMTQKARSKSLNLFENRDDMNVFIISTKCGSVGINLTCANKIILFEPFMNPKVEKQAIGRSWRLGQKRPVTVYKLISKNTIEEAIVKHLDSYNLQHVVEDNYSARREDNAPRNIWNFNSMNALIAT